MKYLLLFSLLAGCSREDTTDVRNHGCKAACNVSLSIWVWDTEIDHDCLVRCLKATLPNGDGQ